MLTYQLIPLSNPFQPLVLGTNVQNLYPFYNATPCGKLFRSKFRVKLLHGMNNQKVTVLTVHEDFIPILEGS
jgi:hypothetical protein